jgi:hypothetical protein
VFYKLFGNHVIAPISNIWYIFFLNQLRQGYKKIFRYSKRIRNDLVVPTTKYVMKIVATTVAVEKSVLSLGAALQRSTMLIFIVFRNSKGQCGILAKDVSDLVVSHGFALYLEVLPIL